MKREGLEQGMKFFFAKARRDLEEKLGRRVLQREISEKLGYQDALVSAWENEVSAPDVSRARDIAAAYGIDPSQCVAEIAEMAARIRARRQKDRKQKDHRLKREPVSSR